MGRRAAKREATRGHILAAADRLFAERGFDATTVDEIADAANVAKGTFYYHFSSKDELLVALIRDSMGQIATHALAALAAGASPVQVLRDFLVGCGQFADTHRHLVRLPMALTLGPGQPGEAREGQASFRRLCAEILAAGQARGEVRGDIAAMEMGQILAMILVESLFSGLASSDGPTIVERVERNFQLFLEGAATKGASRE